MTLHFYSSLRVRIRSVTSQASPDSAAHTADITLWPFRVYNLSRSTAEQMQQIIHINMLRTDLGTRQRMCHVAIYHRCSGVFTWLGGGGGNIVTYSPLGAEDALMNGRRPGRLDALSVNKGLIFSRRRPNSRNWNYFIS